MKKGFILGLTTGVVLTGASLVLANSQIQAILNDQIKVTLNGQIQEFKDETTNETQYPITYHDRTYLPLRTVANLVGVNVDYDASSNTAILKTKDYDEFDELRKIGKEKTLYEDDKMVLKNIYFDFNDENARDLFWTYDSNSKIVLTNKDNKLIIECVTSQQIFEYNLNDNIFSIIVSNGSDIRQEYKVYNIDISTGKEITDEEIVSLKSENIDSVKEKILNEIQYKLTKKNIERSLESYTYQESVISDLKNRLEKYKEYLEFYEIQFYLNNENHLCYIYNVDMGNAAGEGPAPYFYDLETDTLVEAPIRNIN